MNILCVFCKFVVNWCWSVFVSLFFKTQGPEPCYLMGKKSITILPLICQFFPACPNFIQCPFVTLSKLGGWNRIDDVVNSTESCLSYVLLLSLTPTPETYVLDIYYNWLVHKELHKSFWLYFSFFKMKKKTSEALVFMKEMFFVLIHTGM